MKKQINFIIVCFLLAGFQTAEAQITDKPEFGKFAITGATLHTVTNGIINNGVILIDGKEITYVGDNANTSGYTEIDASGKHVYPGFIDSWTRLGLVEVSSVPVTNDASELGRFNPHVRAFTAFNPHSAAIPVTRVSGVTTVISAPSSGSISGKAGLMNLWGYSPDSMAVAGNAALVLNLPSPGKRGWWDQRSEKEIKKQYEESLKRINDYLDKARFYNEMMTAYEENPRGKEQPDMDIELEAMREVVNGDIPVIISVSREKDILAAIEWTEKQEGMRFVFEGVQEGWRVAEELAESGIPCLVSTLYNTTRGYDNYQRPYQNPGLLHEAGVKVAIGTGDTENVRNAPFHAGYAATYGLGTEAAVKALTINPAEIFGAADELGSLEEGKQATLFISDGDPFEPMSQIEQVFIEGNKIPMDSRHIQLYQEFLDRDAVND
ncbi:MAG: amidohydrolase family protein [Balneolaceae bacterium]|nr:amidohydrolase family protein [Balneolaceae bacterium]